MFKYLDKDEARIPHKYSLEDYGLSRGEVHNKLYFLKDYTYKEDSS